MNQNHAHDLLIIQGGGPTAVFNASLYGAIAEAARHRAQIPRILGARHGIEGLLTSSLVDLTDLPDDQLQLLRVSPGASLGSTRYRIRDEDLDLIIRNLRRLDLHRLLVIGGNGTLHGAELMAQAAQRSGYDLCVVGVPKTIDNDIQATDRCPGFASAARFVAQSVRDLSMDLRALPQPVSIFETMGRDAGWLAASSILARMDAAGGPHLIYLPERPFDREAFLDDVDRVVIRHGHAVIVVSEGIRNASDRRIFEIGDESQRDALGRAMPGGVAAHLAGDVARRLGIRCRWEQPGLCGRVSMALVSEQDLIDAEAVGRGGVRAILEGSHLHLVALEPLSPRTDSSPLIRLVPLSGLGGRCRTIDPHWLADSAEMPVNAGFVDYVQPLVGDLLRYATPLGDSAVRANAKREVPQ